MNDAPLEKRYAALTAALAAEGIAEPTLVVDRGAFDRNLARAKRDAGSRALRLVVKSLPCAELLERAGRALGTERLMCFHRPFLQAIARRFPDADVLLGKPLPAAAAAEFYRRHTGPFDPARKLAWLVDTEARLAAYLALARSADLRVRVAIEIDVGLHRGGVPAPEALDPLLALVARNPERLSFAGFMGYDAHVAKAPWPSSPTAAARAVARRYEAFVERARSRFSDVAGEGFVRNGAGSASFALLDAGAPIDDVAIGSALLKPTSFDLPQLAEYEPAAFIATPVLKRLRGVRLPFLEKLAPFTGARRDTLFLYGGRFDAEPAWPPGLRTSAVYGRSSNQEFFSVPREVELGADDYVVFRPTQSEAVLLGFGPLAAIDDTGHVERWPVLDLGA